MPCGKLQAIDVRGPWSRPLLAVLVAALLFGASTPAAKLLLGGIGPLKLAGALYLGAALAALPVAVRRAPRRLRTENRMRLGAAVALGGVVAPVLMLFGLARAGASSVALWLSLETILTALVARALFHEHLGRGGALGVVLVTLASALLAGGSSGAGWRPALFIAAACLCWALDNNFTAVIDELAPAQITLAKGVVAGLFNFTLGSVLEPRTPAATLLGALAVGAVGYGLSLIAYVSGAQQLGAARSQLIFSTAPLFGATTAWLLGIDAIGVLHLVAAALIAAGLFSVGRERHEHAHVHAPVTHAHPHRHDDGHHDHAHAGLPPATWHTHEHDHGELRHAHPHTPDLHHRHRH